MRILLIEDEPKLILQLEQALLAENIAGFALSQLFSHHIQQQLSLELNNHLDQLIAHLDSDENSLKLKGELSDPRFNRPLSGLYWQIDGFNSSLRSRSLWDEKLSLPAGSEHLLTIKLQQQELLVQVREIYLDDEAIFLAVAINAQALQTPIQAFNRELWFALLILGLGLLVAALVQVWLALTPLKRGANTQVLPVLQSLQGVLGKLYQDKAIEFSLQCSDTAHFAGEEAELQEILGNILENAYKWSDSSIHVQVQESEKQLFIRIEDNGPDVSQEQKQQILQRGIRVDEKTPGTGLGLHIVESLLSEYGGSIQLLDSKLGGLAVELWLPAFIVH